MTRRKILLDLRERRFRGQRAHVGDEFWGYTLTREDVDIVNGKGSLPMEEETEKQHGEDSVLKWADAFEKSRCPKCSIGTSNRFLNGLCAKCWREEVTGIDTTAPEKADEITRPGGLRDQFAMATLPDTQRMFGMMPKEEIEKIADDRKYVGPCSGLIAICAYELADAMLEARKK